LPAFPDKPKSFSFINTVGNMSPWLKTTLKIGAGLGIAIILFLGLVAEIVRRYVPSGEDAQASFVIRAELKQSVSTNLPSSQHVTVMCSPRPKATVIFISGGSLTAEEKHSLTALAERIGQAHNQRAVTVVFRE
jgi:hypothetical protein